MRCSAGPDSALRPGRRYGNIDQYFTLQFLYIVMNDPLRFVLTSNHQRVQSSSHTSYLAERAFIDHWIVYLEENSIYPFSASLQPTLLMREEFVWFSSPPSLGLPRPQSSEVCKQIKIAAKPIKNHLQLRRPGGRHSAISMATSQV